MNGNVKSAERALDILEFFALRDEALTLGDVARGLGIPKSSASMLLRTLETRGYLRRGSGRDYRLDPLLRDANSGWVGGVASLLIRVAAPVMRDLVEELRETTMLGVLTRDCAVRVARSMTSPQVVRYELTDTADLPAYCTGMGQVHLAYAPPELVARYLAAVEMTPHTGHTIASPQALQERLEEIRRCGYCAHSEERIVGASGAAAPVFGPGGKVVAAINIATVTFRFLQTRERIIAAVVDGAARITQRLGGEPPAAVRDNREPHAGAVA